MLRPRLNAILCLLACCSPFNAQAPQIKKPSDEVVRISTQLVQTDIVVLDKNGHFVDGLKPEQFEIRINGKPRPILFFERLAAGTANEEVQMAAARGLVMAGNPSASLALDRGRTILFYLDDFHLSANSITRTREMLSKFLESEMGPNDELGIFTGTGQLGFLEQLTSEKTVLRRAIEKIKHRSFQATDSERPPMSETDAMAIMNEDRRILDYFVEQLLRDVGQPRPRQPSAASRTRTQYELLVRGRAKSIVDQVATLNTGSLNGFERFVRASAALPWQKLAFFVSDGFQMIEGNNSSTDLRRIADAASHSATIVYSVDARGLISGAPDSSRKAAFDSTGRLASAGTRSITSSQEPLRTLALDGGGLPILDSNEPLTELRRAVLETSSYYQVAWRPEEHELRDRKFQVVEVRLPQNPDVNVRVRHGFFFEPEVETPVAGRKESNPKKGKEKKKEQDGPLAMALRRSFARRQLPVAVSAGYTDIGEPNLLVTASLELAREALALVAAAENMQLNLAGAVVDETGRPVETFEENLTVNPAEILSSPSRRVVYNQQLRLSPGLYQVRVAIEEKTTGRIGGAVQWLDIPNPKSGNLLLSSVFVGEVDAQTLSSGKLNINADHRFSLRSRLGFMIYVYNAQQGLAGPDVAIQVIVVRDEQPVLTRPLVKVVPDGLLDTARIPYGEDFDLGDLPAGRYILQINAIDRIAKRTATQQTRFSIQ